MDPIRHLLFVYSCQTQDEQVSEKTKYTNGKGFNGRDAKILSSIALYFIKYGRLSEKQMAVIEKRMKKYHRQLPPDDFVSILPCLID
jgi:hypothetical protein